MKRIDKEILVKKANESSKEKPLDVSHALIENMDLSNNTFSDVNFQGTDFNKVRFVNSDLQGSNMSHSLCTNCTFENANLSNVNFTGANLRNCNLSNAKVSGANFYFALLEGANLKGVKGDTYTKFLKMYCPEEGPFIAYKKCFNYRIVQLLVPADAKRGSATNTACRCNKAKVLSIKSIDYRDSFDEARSYVNEDFVYRTGEMAIVKDFNEDRFADSTTGIHFFMTREEAVGYL